MLITRAAIMFSDGETVEGHNYGEILTMANKLGFRGERLYGFLTSSGDFVYPNEAAKIAIEANQITTPVIKLTPEDIWPEYAIE